MVLGFRDEHILEGGQTRQDAASVPADSVSLGWSKDPGADFFRVYLLEFFDEPVRETFQQGVPST